MSWENLEQLSIFGRAVNHDFHHNTQNSEKTQVPADMHIATRPWESSIHTVHYHIMLRPGHGLLERSHPCEQLMSGVLCAAGLGTELDHVASFQHKLKWKDRPLQTTLSVCADTNIWVAAAGNR